MFYRVLHHFQTYWKKFGLSLIKKGPKCCLRFSWQLRFPIHSNQSKCPIDGDISELLSRCIQQFEEIMKEKKEASSFIISSQLR